jgi:hypothetical protein
LCSPGSGLRTIGARYFYEGVWAKDGPLRFTHLTCTSCSHRSPTWDAFKAHRKACPGRMAAGPQTPTAPAPLTGDDLDHLAALYDQLHDEGAA